MAALDFPNPPVTVGQQYAAPTGVLYVWDGTVWTAARATTTLPPSGAAGGDLNGTYPNPQLGAGVIVDADVSATAAIQYTKLTGVPTALPPSGAASGDLTGTYPGPTVAAAKITAAKLSPAPVAGDVGKMVTVAAGPALGYTAVPTSLPPSGAASGDLTGTYPGPTIGAGKVTTTALADAPNGVTTAKLTDGAVTDVKITSVAYAKVTGAPTSLPPSGAAGGDLSGSYPSPQLAAGVIVDADVSATAAIQYSKLTGTPTSLPPSGTAGGDLGGSYPNPLVDGINGAAVGTTTPLARGDLLVANATPALTRLPLGAASTVLQSNGMDAIWGTSLGGPPSGAASGSLAGTYPGPSLAASAVRGTPSSGGTAREIAKASIWAGDDLIDLSVPTAKLGALAVTDAKVNDVAATKLTGTIAQARLPVAPSGLLTANLNDSQVTAAKLAVGATTPTASQADLATFLNVTSATEVVVLTISNFTTRGGRMLFVVNITGLVNAPTSAAQTLHLRGYYGSTQLFQQKYEVILPTGALNGWLSMNYAYTGVFTVAAGTYTFQLRAARAQTDATFQLSQGNIILVDFA